MQIDRYYLKISSLKSLNQVDPPNKKLLLEKVNPPDIEINKFFYKNIGKTHKWVDRLIWDNLKWISYLENKNINTYVLKLNNELVGYFEIIQDLKTKSSEIAYFGILEEYIGKKFGGYLLSEAVKICFQLKSQKVWVHTCSLDHKHALNNYLDRGLEIFKKETINLNLS